MKIKLLDVLKHDFREWIEWVVAGWPETTLGKKMRSTYWPRKFNLKLKSSPMIGRSTKLYGPKIVIGENFSCGEDVEINATKGNGIYIGNEVLMARGVYIRGANHNFADLDLPINKQGHSSANLNYNNDQYSVVIEDNVWVAANVTILSGAKVGRGSIVAAGAVLINANYPPYSIIAGVPGKVIKSRLDMNQG